LGKYSPPKPRLALTTIEVLAGTVLLAFLIVAVLELSGRYQRQRLLARTRIDACQRVDELLFDWFRSKEELPTNSSGLLPGGPTALTWESRTKQLDAIEGIKLGHLRLNVFKTGNEPDTRTDHVPILSISLLVSMEDPTEDLSNPMDEVKP